MRDDVRTSHAVRLGLREIKGLKEEDGNLIVERRTQSLWRSLSAVKNQDVDDRHKAGLDELPYDSVRDVWLRTGLSPRILERLADADAFGRSA